MNRLSIRPIEDLRLDVDALVNSVFPWIRPGSAVFIKPNVTYPRFKPGVTTTPAVIDALLQALRDRSVRRIVVGEGAGGYNAFDMRSALRKLGAERWERRYGVQIDVINDWEALPISVSKRRRTYIAHFPRALRDEFDGLITLPVPKVHAMTVMSGAVKNQWGLIQDPYRLQLHLVLPEILYEFHRLVPAHTSVLIDGTYGLTRNGPMIEGVPLHLGWVAAAADPWIADFAMAGIMGISPSRVPYLDYYMRQGHRAPAEDRPVWQPFQDERFYLRRNLWNQAARLTWHSRWLNHLVYTSGMSNVLHQLMYALRTAPEELSVRGRDWR